MDELDAEEEEGYVDEEGDEFFNEGDEACRSERLSL